MAGKSQAQEVINLNANAGISPVLTRYLALYTVAPTDTTSGTECADAAYTRQVWTPGAVSGSPSSVTNTNQIDFPIVSGSSVTIVAAALVTTSGTSGGAIIYYATVTSQAVPTGQRYQIPVGSATFTED